MDYNTSFFNVYKYFLNEIEYNSNARTNYLLFQFELYTLALFLKRKFKDSRTLLELKNIIIQELIA